ncbi:MAG TPA: beta-eliminating lyase-related protein [Solirubrobacterales bacterium]|nr:beta-eliminating lyase-related protein [Solirubrobacterales bacterium]
MSEGPGADPRGFASDNHSGAHPEVLEAIARANVDHAGSYGEDAWTHRFGELVREHFGGDAVGFPVFNGTAANVLAIDAVTRPHEAVICSAGAHIDIDECGAPERWAGVKLLTAEPVDGKIGPEALHGWEARRDDPHHNQPRLVSVAEATEVGTLYTVDELGALAEDAHAMGMRLHIDGARLANAAAALGTGLGELAGGVGADVISLGATKNGALVGDAVVFLDPGLADRFEYLRKQGMQLASKMRFISAQFEALFGPGELWRRNAGNANAMAARLAAAVADLDGVELVHPVEANGVFARLPRPVIDTLLRDLPGEHPFYVWDEPACVVRWMCSWDTTEADVDGLVAAACAALA